MVFNPHPGYRYTKGTANAETLNGDDTADWVDAGDGDDNLYGKGGNDVLHGDAGNDFLNGGDGNDSLYGDDGNDKFYGLGGADRIDGGTGIDLVMYNNSAAAVIVDLAQGRGYGGEAEGDTYFGIEYVQGSQNNDCIVGSQGANHLDGLGGNDTIDGGAGLNRLNGGTGDDSIVGGANNDTVIGWDGNDTLVGGGGDNSIDGGAGTDLVDYGASAYSVAAWAEEQVSQADPVTYSAIAVDTISGVENIRGSARDDVLIGFYETFGNGGNDTLLGNDGNNIVHGGDGNDRLGTTLLPLGGLGYAIVDEQGDDSLFGEGGADTFNGNSGHDAIDGGDGIDTLDFSYSSDHGGVTVNLEVGFGSGGDAGGDTYVGIENVIGTLTDDVIIGSSVANLIHGNDGDDHVVGSGGADTLDGGNGIDELSYWYSASGVNVRLDTGAVSGGDAAGDLIGNFENLEGSMFDDRLTGSSLANEIRGRSGNDTLFGGEGNDSLSGGAGNDLLVGGQGADSMVFDAYPGLAMNGDDRVLDFVLGVDTMRIQFATSVTALDMQQVGTDTVIRFDDAPGSITLAGVDMNQLLQHAQVDSTSLVFA